MERTKTPFVKPDISSGPGIPKYFWPLFERKETEAEEKGGPLKQEDSQFSEFSTKLDLEEYDFNDEILLDPSKAGLTLDVTALDLYNDDVRKYRKTVIQESRELRNKPKLDTPSLSGLSKAVVRLCRSAFYGTAKSQSLAEAAMPLLIWLLNRKHFPDTFTITVLRGVSEMCWTSLKLKSKFVELFGVKILFRFMRMLPSNKKLATWACYTLCMTASGSSDVILAVKNITGAEELIAEISFEMYWYDWPANFGMILQALVYGPNSVSANDELFQFL